MSFSSFPSWSSSEAIIIIIVIMLSCLFSIPRTEMISIGVMSLHLRIFFLLFLWLSSPSVLLYDWHHRFHFFPMPSESSISSLLYTPLIVIILVIVDIIFIMTDFPTQFLAFVTMSHLSGSHRLLGSCRQCWSADGQNCGQARRGNLGVYEKSRISHIHQSWCWCICPFPCFSIYTTSLCIPCRTRFPP